MKMIIIQNNLNLQINGERMDRHNVKIYENVLTMYILLYMFLYSFYLFYILSRLIQPQPVYLCNFGSYEIKDVSYCDRFLKQ